MSLVQVPPFSHDTSTHGSIRTGQETVSRCFYRDAIEQMTVLFATSIAVLKTCFKGMYSMRLYLSGHSQFHSNPVHNCTCTSELEGHQYKLRRSCKGRRCMDLKGKCKQYNASERVIVSQ